MRRLVGVGVGPGDPELVTVKAVRILAEAGLILVPVMAGAGPGEPGRAEATVRAHIDGSTIRRVPFALDDRGGATPRRRAAWLAAAQEVCNAFAGGTATVAFATIGDPNLYSTFSYLARTVRQLTGGVTVQTVPGITAMQDLAARSGTVLAEGGESLVLVPLSGRTGGTSGQGHDGEGHGGLPDAGPRDAGHDGRGRGGLEAAARDPLALLRHALRGYDTVVAYKLGGLETGRAGGIAPVLAALDEAGRLDGAVYGARLGLPGEDVRPASELRSGAAVPYLSTLIVPPRRGAAGSRLR